MQEMPKLPNKKKNSHCKYVIKTLIFLFTLFLVLFMIFFVIIPIMFKYCTILQESIVFPTYLIDKNVNYSDFKSFELEGVRNLYVNVDSEKNISLGLWEILPEFVLKNLTQKEMYDYEEVIRMTDVNIVLYLHGNALDRTGSIEMYKILRKYFFIVACDYRCYGDSSKGPLKKDVIVSDISFIYKWIRNQTQSNIFIWGHSLGTGVGTEVVSHLRSEYAIPSGLILEAPFTSITDVMERHPLAKVFSWLPWYNTTIIYPMVDNKMNFDSAAHIVNVDCPIMILHAKDDDTIPCDMSEKLYEIATIKRNTTWQGNVTLHILGTRGYRHMGIHLAPQLPFYIKEFLEDSANFKPKKSS